MKTQFTPGPWEVISTDKEVYDGAHVADMSNNLLVIAQSEVGCPVADAHLIAAAPCLLAALQAVLHDCENLGMVESNEPGRDVGPWLMATNAIQKATGSAT